MNAHDRRPARGQPFVVGIGSSGPTAPLHARRALELLAAHPLFALKAASRFYGNPPAGGATTARFLNGAVVVESALPPAGLLLALRGIEHAVGRVRGRRNGPRAIDLDVLLAPAVKGGAAAPTIPHPRLFRRAFALVPADEALRRAGLTPPADVAREALRVPGRASLVVVELPSPFDPAASGEAA